MHEASERATWAHAEALADAQAAGTDLIKSLLPGYYIERLADGAEIAMLTTMDDDNEVTRQ